MRLLFNLIIVLFISGLVFSQVSTSKLFASCYHGGRCTGSSSCSACSNCSACKHCSQNGGSCGVCSGGNGRSNYSSGYHGSRNVRKRSNKRSGNFTVSDAIGDANSGSPVYYDALLTVISSTLNLRSGPGAEYDVLLQLKKGEFVRCVETASGEWIKIEIASSEIEGYVRREFLE